MGAVPSRLPITQILGWDDTEWEAAWSFLGGPVDHAGAVVGHVTVNVLP